MSQSERQMGALCKKGLDVRADEATKSIACIPRVNNYRRKMGYRLYGVEVVTNKGVWGGRSRRKAIMRGKAASVSLYNVACM